MVDRLALAGQIIETGTTSYRSAHAASGALRADRDERAGRFVTGAGAVLGDMLVPTWTTSSTCPGHTRPGTSAGGAPEQHCPGGNRLGKRAALPATVGQPPLPGLDDSAMDRAGGAVFLAKWSLRKVRGDSRLELAGSHVTGFLCAGLVVTLGA
jgi:hypothetical protein